MKLKASNNCIALIKKYEGCRLTAYKCPAGVWTIGYGHTSGVTQNMHITQEQADAYLAKDIEKYETHVNGYTDYNWNQNEFDALVSFAFNLGSIKQLTSNGLRNRQQIADKIPEYCKAGGIKLQGLVNRRAEERDLFLRKPDTLKTVKEIALEVIAGCWGNGTERKKMLESAGYSYKKVQAEVNKIVKAYGK